MKYVVKRKHTPDIAGMFDTKTEATEYIEQLEKQDRDDEVYEPNQYYIEEKEG